MPKELDQNKKLPKNYCQLLAKQLTDLALGLASEKLSGAVFVGGELERLSQVCLKFASESTKKNASNEEN